MPKPSMTPLRSPVVLAKVPEEPPVQPLPDEAVAPPPPPPPPPQRRGQVTPARAEQSSKRQEKPKRRQEKPKRRFFSAAEKLRIVREADACAERGEIEALLRREGIYSSHLSEWRRALRLYGEKGVATRGPGRPRTRDPKDDVIVRLEREVASLRRDLERMQTVIDVQKKVSALLGLTLESCAR